MINKAEETPATEAELQKTDHRAWWSLGISLAAAAFTGGNLYTQRQALNVTRSAAVEAQKTAIFSQFQQQYDAVRDDFPPHYMNPKFRPTAGSEEYARLQAYWYFCFSEWFATHRVNSRVLGSLWIDYYAPLIADGLKIRSLRQVLEDRVRARGVGRGDWTVFLKELARIARAHGEPLSADVERRINGDETAKLESTDVSFASTRSDE